MVESAARHHGVRALLHGFPEADPEAMGARARAVEDAGWDGLLLADSQNLAPEVFVALTVAAGATRRIELGPAVTNPVSRHPAVVASAISTLQRVSHGRAVLGLGRGDSALLQIGLEPQSRTDFERDATRIRDYLHGDTVDEAGYGSRLAWLDGTPPVPLQIFASGPRLTRAAATVADRLTVVVGARPERVVAHVELARRARSDAGLDPDALDVGAYVIVGVDPDRERARRLVRGNVSIFAHFQRGADNLGSDDHAVVSEVTARWQEATHGVAASPQADALTPEFIDDFAVVGDQSTVRDRLRELLDLGLGHVVLIGASRDVPADEADRHTTAMLDVLRAAAHTESAAG
ncbi:LLM class flavin-dependent oxidoreductase [Actinomycetospora sp. C-140]